MRLPGVSIVLPCLNEVDNLGEAVREANKAGKLTAYRHEVIVVDDGSTDGTGALAAEIAARDPHLRVVSHEINRGYGSALRSGIAAATMPWVFLTDADLQFNLEDLGGFVEHTHDHSLIVGRRIKRRDPMARRINAAAWNWLVRRIFHVPVHDVDCAFKLIRRDILTRVELVSSGAAISIELIVGCLAAGAELLEIGVEHLPRAAGKQSGANPQVVMRAFRELVKLRERGPAVARPI
jgi:glycosyltransferase involved in cell wall biosynthesis